MLYKIVDYEGRSCHNGGYLQWSLPVDGKPGEWHEVTGPLELCREGLHLTDAPAHWFKPGCRVFEVEAEGVEGDPDENRKAVARRVRLTREVSRDEQAAVGIFYSGAHEWMAGKAIAYDSATVWASGSAMVEAYDSATVRASGSATVTGTDAVTVVSWWGKPGVRIDKRAIWIERGEDSTKAPIVHVAEVK